MLSRAGPSYGPIHSLVCERKKSWKFWAGHLILIALLKWENAINPGWRETWYVEELLTRVGYFSLVSRPPSPRPKCAPTPIEQLSLGSNEQGRSPCQTMSEQQWGINTVLKQTQTPWLRPTISSESAIFRGHNSSSPKPAQAPRTAPGSTATVSRAPYLEDKGLTRADSCGHISRNVPVSNVTANK